MVMIIMPVNCGCLTFAYIPVLNKDRFLWWLQSHCPAATKSTTTPISSIIRPTINVLRKNIAQICGMMVLKSPCANVYRYGSSGMVIMPMAAPAYKIVCVPSNNAVASSSKKRLMVPLTSKPIVASLTVFYLHTHV